MPCFHIQTVDDPAEPHVERRQLEDLAAARRVASHHLANLLIAAQPSVHDAELRVQVTDEQGMLLFIVTAFATEAPAAMR
jgi:hypothetical protein